MMDASSDLPRGVLPGSLLRAVLAICNPGHVPHGARARSPDRVFLKGSRGKELRWVCQQQRQLDSL